MTGSTMSHHLINYQQAMSVVCAEYLHDRCTMHEMLPTIPGIKLAERLELNLSGYCDEGLPKILATYTNLRELHIDCHRLWKVKPHQLPASLRILQINSINLSLHWLLTGLGRFGKLHTLQLSFEDAVNSYCDPRTNHTCIPVGSLHPSLKTIVFDVGEDSEAKRRRISDLLRNYSGEYSYNDHEGYIVWQRS